MKKKPTGTLGEKPRGGREIKISSAMITCVLLQYIESNMYREMSSGQRRSREGKNVGGRKGEKKE